MNKQSWYAKLSKVISLLMMIFILAYMFMLRLCDNFTIGDAVLLLCMLLISAALGNMENTDGH